MRPSVSRLCDMLGGLTIIEADTVLDGARRLIWLHTFTGRPFEAAAVELDAPRNVVEAAGLILAGIGAVVLPASAMGNPCSAMVALFSKCDGLLAEARLTLWTAAHMHDADSHFGQYFRSWEAEAERYAQPPNMPSQH